MKTTQKRIVPAADSERNHVGLLAWSLLAHPQSNRVGGIPGQPDPDTPNEQPSEPGEPMLPDEPPPAPVV
ncbi:hypothetical protein [Pseudomonas sp. NA-150]|uniref:hypothetical protein n=1 Tax=Pseudomonas sp. NA-150 TaxID=3367525 RepID=UPI0037C690F9